jgi:hypothetical protein
MGGVIIGIASSEGKGGADREGCRVPEAEGVAGGRVDEDIAREDASCGG